MTMRVNFDPKILTFKSIDKGPALPNAMIDKNESEADPGIVAIGFLCGSKADGKSLASVEDDGVVLKLVFVVSDKATTGQKSSLKVDNYRAVDSSDPPFEVEVRPRKAKSRSVPAAWRTCRGCGSPSAQVGVALLLLIILFLATRRKQHPYGMPYAHRERIERPGNMACPVSMAPGASAASARATCRGRTEIHAGGNDLLPYMRQVRGCNSAPRTEMMGQ